MMYVNIGTGHGLVSSGNKPLPEAILVIVLWCYMTSPVTRPTNSISNKFKIWSQFEVL